MLSQEDKKHDEIDELLKITPSPLISPESVNKDVLPLVFPAVIPKSSKDPNRGLYPRKRPHSFNEASDIVTSPGPTISFTKASNLYKSRLRNKKNSMEDRLNKPFAADGHIPSLENRLNKYSSNDRLNSDFSNTNLVAPSTSNNICVDDLSLCKNYQVSSIFCHAAQLYSNSKNNKARKKKTKSKHVEKADQSKSTLLKYYTKTDSTLNANGSIAENDPEEKSGSGYDVKEIEEITDNSISQYDTNSELVSVQPVFGKHSSLCNATSISKEGLSFECCQKSEELTKTDPYCLKSGITSSSLEPADVSSMKLDIKLQISNSETGQHTDDETYHFGLFGASNKCNEEIEEENYFEYLPIDLMELIICQIPFLDLMKLRCVCKSWNEIISNPKFLEWKKTYYCVKSGRKQSQSWQSAVSYFETDTICIENCFSTLISFMCTDYVRRPPDDLDTFLQQFPRCVNAKQLLVERFPEKLYLSENPWCILTVTVLLSEVVEDVYDILHLLKCEHPYQYESVLEAMYCVATVLLYFIRTFSINHGPHYRVFNAIYLLENRTPVNTSLCSVKPEIGLPGQQSLHSYCEPVVPRMTYEQIRILNHKLHPKQIIKIIAFAGTGKTSTLIQFARIYSNLKFLNIMFNKAACDFASAHFPANVVCKTAHSLAYQAVGRLYRHKLNFKLKPHDILPLLFKPESIRMHMHSYARCILQTIESFTQSADEHITTAHVPRCIPKLPHRMESLFGIRIDEVLVSDAERLAILDEAEKLWEKMISRDINGCKITHDIYLKMFQLRHPKISHYDCIMIDEAQDCNRAMLDIILSQNVPIILVGDPNQQIYAFRGARNSLQSISATHTYHLTRSFRFGPKIAYIASCCLEMLQKNTSSTLVGNLKESYVDGTVKGQYAVIARTNEKLFMEAIRLCCTRERRQFEPDNFCGAFVGGLGAYGFDQIIAIYNLRAGKSKNQIPDPFIRKFNTFNDLHLYAVSADDRSIGTKIELILRYGSNIIHHINQIKQKCAYDLEMATVVFSTAHKAKGLEFDTVSLVNDFQVGNITSLVQDSTEEANILYVALTRAKKCLVICEKLHFVLLNAQEKFEYPVPSSVLLKDLINLTCVVCSTTFLPHTTFTLVRRNLEMSHGRKTKGGPLCMKCSTNPYYTPEVHFEPAIVRMDPIKDFTHSSLASFVGPLPSDKPIVHITPDNFDDGDIQEFIFAN